MGIEGAYYMTHIFCAITNADIVPFYHDKTGLKPNIMEAFNYIKGQSFKLTNTYRDRINLLYLDSGAYSVSTGKSKIDVYGYLNYLKKYGHKFDLCFNLDDRFDDPDHNLLHQFYLENGLIEHTVKPVPVIHDNTDPLTEFDTYVALGHLYIAIGSSGSSTIKDKLLTHAKQRHPNVKVHLFGDLDRNLLEKHRPYSADSAGWAYQAGKGGGIYYWRPSENRQYVFNVGGRDSIKGGVHIKLSPLWEEIRAFLYDTFRYEYNDILKYEVRYILNFYSNQQFEDYLNSLDKK